MLKQQYRTEKYSAIGILIQSLNFIKDKKLHISYISI